MAADADRWCGSEVLLAVAVEVVVQVVVAGVRGGSAVWLMVVLVWRVDMW